MSLLSVALLFPLLPVLSVHSAKANKHFLRFRQLRSLAPWPNSSLSQVTSPSSLTTSLDTTEIFFQGQSSDTVPSYLFDANSTMRPSGKRSLHHCSFRSEKNQRTEDKLITLVKKVCCQLSLFVCHSRTGRPVHELSSLSSCSREKPNRDSEDERIRILFERQKEQILDDFRAEIQKHEFQADSDGRSIRGTPWYYREKLIILLQVMIQKLRRDQLLLHEQFSEQKRDLREAHVKKSQ